MKRDVNTIINGARCCLNLDNSTECEGCPYVAAGEECAHELEADLLSTAQEAEHLIDWTARAVAWLRFREPDALIAMVDAIGEYIPDPVRWRVFGNEQDPLCQQVCGNDQERGS